MKALAINSSPKMDQGATALILAPFLQGLTEEGVDVEILYIRKLDFKPCLADYTCWMKTHGRRAWKAVYDGVKSGELSEGRIDETLGRILDLKKRYGLVAG